MTDMDRAGAVERAARALADHLQLAIDLWSPARGADFGDDMLVSSMEKTLDDTRAALSREPREEAKPIRWISCPNGDHYDERSYATEVEGEAKVHADDRNVDAPDGEKWGVVPLYAHPPAPAGGEGKEEEARCPVCLSDDPGIPTPCVDPFHPATPAERAAAGGSEQGAATAKDEQPVGEPRGDWFSETARTLVDGMNLTNTKPDVRAARINVIGATIQRAYERGKVDAHPTPDAGGVGEAKAHGPGACLPVAAIEADRAVASREQDEREVWIRADERERCAKVCERIESDLCDETVRDGTIKRMPEGGHDATPAEIAAQDCAAAIRALDPRRGESGEAIKAQGGGE